MSRLESEKALAAARAVDEVRAGMLVGLGTGSTAAYAVKSLSDRIRQGLRITAVATSQATETLARRLQVPLVPFQRISSVDLTIDGADEIDAREGECREQTEQQEPRSAGTDDRLTPAGRSVPRC